MQQPKELPRGRGWSWFWITLRVCLGRIFWNQGQSRFQLCTVRTSELSELLQGGRAERICQLRAPEHTACPVSCAGHTGCRASWTSWLPIFPSHWNPWPTVTFNLPFPYGDCMRAVMWTWLANSGIRLIQGIATFSHYLNPAHHHDLHFPPNFSSLIKILMLSVLNLILWLSFKFLKRFIK